MMAGLFGIAASTGYMPGILPKPTGGGGVVHVEVFCNNASASATVQLMGTISGSQWNAVGSPIVCSGVTPQWMTATNVNYSYYKVNVTAISGASANVSAYMGS